MNEQCRANARIDVAKPSQNFRRAWRLLKVTTPLAVATNSEKNKHDPSSRQALRASIVIGDWSHLARGRIDGQA